MVARDASRRQLLIGPSTRISGMPKVRSSSVTTGNSFQ
jgi:hypothetical protein